MSTEHREIRESLGSWAMGHLDPDERDAIDYHLEGCPECRAEAESLKKSGAMLKLVDPAIIDTLSEPLPQPPDGLEERVMADLKDPGQPKRRWRVLVPLAGALAAAVVALVLVLGGGDQGGGGASRSFAFSSLPPGVSIAGTMEPKATGTGIVVDVDGMKPGTLCRVFVKTSEGKLEPAGTFRYRYDANEAESYPATLSTAWDLSEIENLVIKAGPRTFRTRI